MYQVAPPTRLATPDRSDWARWFRSAVQGGARQAWGTERWLHQHPDRVFLDPECKNRFPVRIPGLEAARYHLVVTVHGVSAACQSILGGTGSLMIGTDVRGFAAHHQPFLIGDLDPGRTFVFVMATLDTTTDVVRYLREKERLCRSHALYVAGEENLLAHYLTHVDEKGDHALTFDQDADLIAIDESWWADFESSEERRAQIEHDQVSYLWDTLIEKFAHHALGGAQYFATEPSVDSAEKVLRFMAAEPRLRRRVLAAELLDAVEITPPDQRRIRLVPRQLRDEPMYVFLVFPWRDDKPGDNNRTVRRNYLEMCLHVAKMKYPSALDVIGIATESGGNPARRSEDAMYMDTRPDYGAQITKNVHGAISAILTSSPPSSRSPSTWKSTRREEGRRAVALVPRIRATRRVPAAAAKVQVLPRVVTRTYLDRRLTRRAA